MSTGEKALKLREMPWGFGCDDKTLIYDTGHLDRQTFLAAVKFAGTFDVPQHTIETLMEKDVKHMIVRRLSPSEARSHGVDWGYMEDGGRNQIDRGDFMKVKYIQGTGTQD